MEDEKFNGTELHPVKIDQIISSEGTNFSPSKHHFACGSKTCSFSTHRYSEAHASQRSKTMLKLCGLLSFYLIAMVIEIFGGLRANSLAVLTDAAHLLTDIVGFSISLFAIWVSGWEATSRQSFGYNRLEVIGALLSVQLIWLISGALIYQAIMRLISTGSKVNGELMLMVAAFGFLINLLMVLWLGHDHHSHHGHSHHHHSHDCENHHNHDKELDEEIANLMLLNPPQSTEIPKNINIQGAYLHLITDLIQSIGVMIAGIVMWVKPKWLVVDLICTLIFSSIALFTTLPMLKSIFYILMERAPSEIDTLCLENGLRNISGVVDVHDLHVWAITVGKHVLSCHVVIGPEVGHTQTLCEIREFIQREFRIHHSTIQIEQEQ